MDRFVARANVEHFRDLIANEAKLPERERLAKMLLEEEAKLAEAERLHDEATKGP